MMQKFLKFSLSLLLCCLPPSAQAGFLELDISGSYRRNSITADQYDTNQAITGSLSYYFWENSAIEMSYTDGQYVKKYPAVSTLPAYEIVSHYNMLGLDLVLAYGSKGSTFRPYLKAGGMQINKRVKISPEGYESDFDVIEPVIVPNLGIGFKLNLSQTFGIKFGYESWPANSLDQPPVIWDFSSRVGLSWFLL